MKLQKNMGTTDRFIRGFFAVALAGAAYSGLIVGGWALVAYVVAAVLVLTSVVAFCPPYALFGWKTCGCDAPLDSSHT